MKNFKAAIQIPYIAYFKMLILGALLTYTFYPTFAWMVDRWTVRDSYFAHGFLIPLVSLYWIFKKRNKLILIEKKTEPVGLMILLAASAIQIFSSIFRIYFISAFSFVFILLSTVYFLCGKKTIKEIWFPIAFLFLMIPLPLLFISEVTLKMKFFVSEISTHLINSIGIKAVRQGSYILTPNAVCLVGDPCSGLRSFLAFLCLGLVFAYSDRLQTWKKVILVATGLPLAIVSNVIRVFGMTLIGEIYGMDLAKNKMVHDGAGILVFVIALMFFIVLRKKLEEINASAR